MRKQIGERISTEDHERSTTVVILPRRVGWKEQLLLLWVIGFSLVGAYMMYLLFFGGIDSLNTAEHFDEDVRRQQLVYLAVFVAFWAYFEYITLKGLLWNFFGKELLLIDTDALSVKKSILSYGRAHRHFLENIKAVRYKKSTTSLNQFLDNAYWSRGQATVQLEGNHQTQLFGHKLSEREARLLVRFICDRLKKWKKKK